MPQTDFLIISSVLTWFIIIFSFSNWTFWFYSLGAYVNFFKLPKLFLKFTSLKLNLILSFISSHKKNFN